MAHLLAVLSGAAWAILLMGPFGRFEFEGLVVSVLTGFVMGLAIWPFRDVDWRVGIVLSLAGLYLAAALFVIIGATGAIARGDDVSLHRIVNAVSRTWWALTYTPAFLLLWPLSCANHAMIWAVQRVQARPRGKEAAV